MSFQTIITPQILALNIDNPKWLILDCRGTFLFDKKSYESFAQAHIPKAFFFSLTTCTHPKSASPNTLFKASQEIKHNLSENGYDAKSQIVLYDENDCSDINNLWLQIRAMGFLNVAVLQGGLNSWKAYGNSVSSLNCNPTIKKVFAKETSLALH